MLASFDGERLVEVRGDKDNPDSQGFLCVRGQASREILGNPERVLLPLMRAGRNSDSWNEVSWDEALDRIVGDMRSVGRESVGLWLGHGSLANDFGVFANAQLAMRFAMMYGCQTWEGSMICWGLGGFGIGLTGAMEINTKEDMGDNADMIVMWGANFAANPNTARHVAAAKRRGAHIVAVDVRVSEACKSAHEYFLVRPGTDAALALAMMHVIVDEDLQDDEFIAEHTIGFDQLRKHLRRCTPRWASEITGIRAGKIVEFARRYANTERAMIMLSGSSMYKDRNGWQSSRAISCLPPLTGKLGKPGTGFGARHAGMPNGHGLGNIVNFEARPPGDYIPNQMSEILDAMSDGRLRAMLLFGTNMLSSFADAGRVAKGLAKMDLVVSHDLFMTETARRHADVVLPATAWLEEVGCKGTPTHIYLMEEALEPAGQARSMTAVMKQLASRLEVEGFYPWDHEYGHIDAVLDHPATGRATVASLRESGGMAAMNISAVAHVDHKYTTPSGKIEFYSERAAASGLPALPTYNARPSSDFPLELRMGRTLDHFHSFYDHGRALPSIAKLEPGPTLWISKTDAKARGLANGAPIRIHNERGECEALAEVNEKVPPGTVWMHDGWPGMNTLTAGTASLPDDATDFFPFTTGQSAYDAHVEVSARD